MRQLVAKLSSLRLPCSSSLPMTSDSRWTFFRAGGFDQVKLDTGDDLLRLEHLDQKLWVALACPTSGLQIDRRTLELIDTDGDGRVRAPELIAAVRFAASVLKDPNELTRGKAALELSSMRTDTELGSTMVSAARQILANLGKPEATSLSVEDLIDPQKVFADAAFNGDGIITESACVDDASRQVLAEILDCIGQKTDRSGKPGIDLELIETFYAQLREYASWYEESSKSERILVLGPDRTAPAAAAIEAVRTKIDDYFTRCRLAAFDSRLTSMLNRKEEEYLEVAARDLSLSAKELEGFPLAQITAGRGLPLEGAVNPAHAAALLSLKQLVVLPLLGTQEQLTEADWVRLTTEFAPYFEWQAAKRGKLVEKLGNARVTEILATPIESTLKELVSRDKALEEEVKTVENVERAVRYHRDLHLLCINFVNFRDFYDGRDPAIFQCGTLYIDQRACKLCLRVNDPAAHAAMAGLAGAFLVYAECKRPATSEKMHIVAVLTSGDSDNLMVGRNGLFYDRNGLDWDATITKIIDSPISIRQAFWAPYKKFVRLIEEQVAKRAATADGESQGKLSDVALNVATADKTPPPTAKKIDVGSVAALGVAVGAIGTFFTAMVGYITGILQLGIFATIGAAIGVMLLISMPSVILASITLRKRNLGPILDANGWAVNAKAKVNVTFGATLTSVAKLPPGAQRESLERYVDPGLPWKRIVFLVLLGIVVYRWCDGSLDRVLPRTWQSRTVFSRFLSSRMAPVTAPLPPRAP